jgi:FtsP/CotA-like multicopper oxidase with cupredoxin domain
VWGLVLLALLAVGGVTLLAVNEDDGDSSSLVAFSEPPRVSASEGYLEEHLTASEQVITAGTEKGRGRSYNGEFIGPTLVLEPGDDLGIELENNTAEPTNLHFHGFHVSPRQHSDQVVDVKVLPGESFPYRVHIPDGHDEGTYWYHSHMHHHTEDQVFGGMAGVALIGTPAVPAWIEDYEDRVLALKDFEFQDGEMARDFNSTKTTRTINGLVNPEIEGAPNSIELWRLANISAGAFYKVELEGHQLFVIGEDGNFQTEMWPTDSLVLPPGRRYDVLVQFGDAGTYELKTLKYRIAPDREFPESTLATVSVSGDPVEQESLKMQQKLMSERVPPVTGPSRRKVLTQDEEEGKFFLINGKAFSPKRIDDWVKLGTVEEWTFVNATTEEHPIHIHQNPFWVVAENGSPIVPTGKQDVVIVPTKERVANGWRNGSVTLRVPFKDFPGKFVYHCHILFHEDHGMMGVINASKSGKKQRGAKGKRGGASSPPTPPAGHTHPLGHTH